jgi:hypothetical protein
MDSGSRTPCEHYPGLAHRAVRMTAQLNPDTSYSTPQITDSKETHLTFHAGNNQVMTARVCAVQQLKKLQVFFVIIH